MRAALSLLAASLVSSAALAQPYTFEYFAGSVGGPGAFDSIGSAARFNRPLGLLIDDSTGILYVSDSSNNTIRVIKPGWSVSTFAGTARTLRFTEGAARGDSAIRGPEHLTMDGAGNLYVAGDGRIRKITPTGVTTTLAGAGWGAWADGTGTAAEFASPSGVAYDPTSGALFVADTHNHTIRKVTLAGVVTTFAGTHGEDGSTDAVGPAARFNQPRAVAVDASGYIWVADSGNHTIRRITPGGSVSTVAGLAGAAAFADATGSAARFNTPSGIVINAAGVAFVADTNNSRIRKVTAAGVVTSLAGGTYGSEDGTGGLAQFAYPTGIDVAASGDVYVTDAGSNTIRRVTSLGVVSTVAGAAAVYGAVDAQGINARFYTPRGMAADAAGNLFVADESNQTIRQITPAGAVTTFAGTAGEIGMTDATGSLARFYTPHALAIDGSGNLYLTDREAHTIRKITPAAVVTTFAGTFGDSGTTDATGPRRASTGPRGSRRILPGTYTWPTRGTTRSGKSPPQA